MRKLNQLLGMVAVTGMFLSCSSGAVQDANYQVIPLPQEIVTATGKPFMLDSGVKIIYPEGNEKMQKNAEFLAGYIKEITGKDLKIETGTEGKHAIVLKLGLDAANAEAYNLKVDGDAVTIAAPTEAGVFYGIQTLRKSLPITKGDVELTAVEINDYPRFGYRGVHFDISRHFFTVEEAKTYIDMMVLHNMNRLHWHLTDDQGWRLEIKKYPLLTEIGSKRAETVIGRNSGEYDGKPYEGFYTREQAKEIIAYAADRYITVIPEIDLPGHMQAALAAYPELGCTGGPYEVWTQWGVSDNVLCAGNDKVLAFIDDVFTEIMEIFPSEYIHVGGDECPKDKWKECPKCQARIKALGIKSDSKHSKEEYLQSFVINHAEKFLNDHGRRIIGWDEILEGGLAPNATVMSWRGEAGGIEAAKQHHDVIMTPNTYLYFDYYQTKDIEDEPLAIGGYLPIDHVYGYEPMPASLSREEQKHIIGVQANHWSEYFPSFSQLQYMALPRWAALAEIQWTMPEKKDYDLFLARMLHMMDLYKLLGYNYAKHILNIHAEFVPNPATKSVDVTLSSIDHADIHYTLDGTEPTAASPKYTEPLKIDKDCTLKAVIVRPSGNSKVFTENLTFNKATVKPVTMNQPINKQYAYKGENTLVDGLKGNKNYKTGRWIAFYKNNMEAVIDMLEPTEISNAQIETCVEQGDWVFDARSFTVEVSDDGKAYRKVASDSYPAMKEDGANGVHVHELHFDPVKARYVKITVEPEYSIPAWHNGKGNPAFVFIDEISLN